MKKFQNKKPTELHPLATKIILSIKRVLISVAMWLQKKANHYSPAKIKALVILFSAVFATECAFIIYQSLQNTNKFSPHIATIKPITHLKEKSFTSLGDRKDFNRILGIKDHLDSLQKADKRSFDRLLSLRPHLMDTINYLEKLYYEQQTNGK